MNRALLLDRDGVINIDHGYTVEIDQFEFMPGIFSLVTTASRVGFKIIVVTNQSGIGRGYYSEQQFHQLSDWMKGQFVLQAAPVDAIYHCPHHPLKALPPYLKECECRKPGAGMLLAAQRDFALDMSASIMLGDKVSDMQAAARAGVGRRILLSETAANNNGGRAIEPATEVIASLHEVSL